MKGNSTDITLQSLLTGLGEDYCIPVCCGVVAEVYKFENEKKSSLMIVFFKLSIRSAMLNWLNSLKGYFWVTKKAVLWWLCQ